MNRSDDVLGRLLVSLFQALVLLECIFRLPSSSIDRSHHFHINVDHNSIYSILHLHATQATTGTMSSIFKILSSIGYSSLLFLLSSWRRCHVFLFPGWRTLIVDNLKPKQRNQEWRCIMMAAKWFESPFSAKVAIDHFRWRVVRLMLRSLRCLLFLPPPRRPDELRFVACSSRLCGWCACPLKLKGRTRSRDASPSTPIGEKQDNDTTFTPSHG